MSAQPQFGDKMLKLIFLGDTGVGKRSLLLRFTGGDPHEVMSPESGAYRARTLTIDKERVTFQLWDAAGQERFRSLTSSYYRGANGVILVYDVTSSVTFANIENWLQELNRYTTDDVPKFLVGNHIESGTREVTLQTAKDFAESLRFPLFEVSAMEGKNTEEAFQAICKDVYRRCATQTLHTSRVVPIGGSVSSSPYSVDGQSQNHKRICCS